MTGRSQNCARICEVGVAGSPVIGRRRGGILNITAAAWTAGFQWWHSGDITRTQNVSEYMLVLALCLVSSCDFFFFFFSPNLSGRRLDVYHTSIHGVALVRISNAGLKRAVRSSLKIQNAKNRKKVAIWAPSHNFVGLYLCK